MALNRDTKFIRLNPSVAKVKALRGLVTGTSLTTPYYEYVGLKKWVGELVGKREIDCALAYSSAITMCSGGTLYDHNANWTSYISVSLCALTIGLVLWNYKGRRTILAVLTVIVGSLIILHTEFVSGNVTNYYIGSSMVFLGVWLNGSFWHFVRKWGVSIFSVNRLKSNVPDAD